VESGSVVRKKECDIVRNKSIGKKLAVLIMVALWLSAAHVACAQSAPDSTMGLLNGDFWKMLPDLGKLLYVAGYTDGLTGGCMGDPKKLVHTQGELDKITKCTAGWIPKSISLPEIKSRLDMFYAPPENLNIELIDALRIIGMQANGTAQSEIDQQMDAARKGVKRAGR
jgi:hypothetical protein